MNNNKEYILGLMKQKELQEKLITENVSLEWLKVSRKRKDQTELNVQKKRKAKWKTEILLAKDEIKKKERLKCFVILKVVIKKK